MDQFCPKLDWAIVSAIAANPVSSSLALPAAILATASFAETWTALTRGKLAVAHMLRHCISYQFHIPTLLCRFGLKGPGCFGKIIACICPCVMMVRQIMVIETSLERETSFDTGLKN